ncbi:MAG TPA: type II toxin-antitoxin system VapC family toxin [Bryobacteraceae bacterium]|nr:type II toxin-antitoxin system VapC family toxin [Bryobacteraceae bacterium]
MAFVLDASVAVSWCFPGDPTEDRPYGRRVLAALATEDAIVPELWGYEIANSVFISFSRRKRISTAQIDEYLRLLKALPISVETRDLWSNVDLQSRARQWNLTVYDAAYLDLALRRDLRLATADEELKRVAVAEGVKILT